MRRAILKVTGEAAGTHEHPFDREKMAYLADEIASVAGKAELGVVLGGGNVVRGGELARDFPDVPAAALHWMGITATRVNSFLLHALLEQRGVRTRLMGVGAGDPFTEPYSIPRARGHLSDKHIVLFTGGSGNAYFSHDSAAVLRALEVSASILLKGTKVDGVYTADPKLDQSATFLPALTPTEFLSRGLDRILDRPAMELASGEKLPIFFFNFFERGNLERALLGTAKGTLVSSS